jgi:hypothetical protein
MRRSGLKALCLIAVFMVVVAGAALADDQTLNLESKVVQTFDTPEEQQWFVLGSKFASAGYPKLTFIKNTWPLALHGSAPKDPEKLSVLGVAMLFDRKEYNWVDVVPGVKTTGSDGKVTYKPSEIPLPGRVSALDTWVWGSGFKYYLEAYVRDYRGIVYKLKMGMIDFEGWRNMRVNIPTSIPQSKQTLPKRLGLTLVKFRIWTTPTEAVAVLSEDENVLDLKATAEKDKEQPISKAIFVYFDQIKILTDTFETLYDGDSLSDMENIKKNWSSGGSGK